MSLLARSAAVLLLLALTSIAKAQQSQPDQAAVSASGTLNLILANRNGFVVAADSRMSSDKPFMCSGRLQLYCDNSQKLFRTGPESAMVIAGFAVGRENTPLDLTVASVLRNRFGTTSFPANQPPQAIPMIVEDELEESLTGVASLFEPTTASANLGMTVTFARRDSNGLPILQQLVLNENWVPRGPLNRLAPSYEQQLLSREVPVTNFVFLPVGITFVAEGIREGVYKSDDPALRNYYSRAKAGTLNDMTIAEMSELAHAVLRETKRLTDLVGGSDQIGIFPAKGDVDFELPSRLPSDKQLPPHVMRWEGLSCSKTQIPPCGRSPVSFNFDIRYPFSQPYIKLLVASQFKDVSVALDNNLFVGDDFDGATIKWRGGPVLLRRNTFENCLLELTPDADLSRYPELNRCRIERKAVVDVLPNTIGRPFEWMPTDQGGYGIRDSNP